MSTDETMTIDERYKYLRLMQRRYAKANRRERQALLDEMVAVTGCHRKSLVRHMKDLLKHELGSATMDSPELSHASLAQSGACFIT